MKYGTYLHIFEKVSHKGEEIDMDVFGTISKNTYELEIQGKKISNNFTKCLLAARFILEKNH